MRIYQLSLPGAEIVRLVRAEIRAAGGQPELYQSAWQDYLIEEDFDRRAYGVGNGEEYDLVSSAAVLAIEPRVERNYWVLKVIVREELGARTVAEENAMLGAALSLDEFEAKFLAAGRGRVTVQLETETPEARRHFDRWLTDLRARHAAAPAPAGIAAAEGASADPAPESEAATYSAREVVGVFPSADALESAVGEIELAGCDRSAISVLASDERIRDRLGRLYRSVREAEDDAAAPRSAFISSTGRTEAEAAAVGLPFFIAGLAGAAGVAATGGTLALAIAATIGSGAAAGGLGALLARAIAKGHAHDVEHQLARGGLVLWVGVRDKETEKRVIDVLTRLNASHVHVHELRRPWGVGERPMQATHPDPFLERDV